MLILVTRVVTSSTCFMVICCLDYCQVKTQASGVGTFANIPLLDLLQHAPGTVRTAPELWGQGRSSSKLLIPRK